MYHSIYFEEDISHSYVPSREEAENPDNPITPSNYDIWRKEKFNTIDLFERWQLVSTTRPVIPPPGLKFVFEDLPGSDGGIDYTDTLTGYPLFNNITGTWTFYVLNQYDEYDWMAVYTEVKRYLHGQHKRVFLEDDPEHYYVGRFAVSGWSSSDKFMSQISIQYNLEPYRYCINTSDEEWLWDPFNFLTGVVPTAISHRGDETEISYPSYKDIKLRVNIIEYLEYIWEYVEGPVLPEIIYNPGTPKDENGNITGVNFALMDWRNPELSLGSDYQETEFKRMAGQENDNFASRTFYWTDNVLSNINGHNTGLRLNFSGWRYKTNNKGVVIMYGYNEETHEYEKDENDNLVPTGEYAGIILESNSIVLYKKNADGEWLKGSGQTTNTPTVKVTVGKAWEQNSELPLDDPVGYGTVTIRFRKKVL